MSFFTNIGIQFSIINIPFNQVVILYDTCVASINGEKDYNMNFSGFNDETFMYWQMQLGL